MMQWATPHVIPLTVFQRVSLEMSRCANWTAVPVKPLYRRWHSADGENLASPEDRLCEAATAPFKGGGGGGKKTKHCTTETSESFCNPSGGNLPCTPPCYCLLSDSALRRERTRAPSISFHLGQVSLCSNWTLVDKQPDDWPETQQKQASLNKGNKGAFPFTR